MADQSIQTLAGNVTGRHIVSGMPNPETFRQQRGFRGSVTPRGAAGDQEGGQKSDNVYQEKLHLIRHCIKIPRKTDVPRATLSFNNLSQAQGTNQRWRGVRWQEKHGIHNIASPVASLQIAQYFS